jgi:hypothetical protein
MDSTPDLTDHRQQRRQELAESIALLVVRQHSRLTQQASEGGVSPSNAGAVDDISSQRDE